MTLSIVRWLCGARCAAAGLLGIPERRIHVDVTEFHASLGVFGRNLLRHGRETVPFDETLHESRARRYRDRIMQRFFVPAGSEHCVRIRLGHRARRQHQLAHERQQRLQSRVDRRGFEVFQQPYTYLQSATPAA